MTLQWTAVALFLYVEIGVLLILCLPFISATSHLVITFALWRGAPSCWKRHFLSPNCSWMVGRSCSRRIIRGAKNSNDANLHPNMFDHLHMKLFRAQRNLYISGFSLFLWLRVITLINQLATESSTTASLQTKAECANQTAKKYMEDNELLKQVRSYPVSLPFLSEMEKLRGELKGSEEALKKSQSEMEAMKKQSDGLTKEYDRLNAGKGQNLGRNLERNQAMRGGQSSSGCAGGDYNRT
uniref:Endoplasmic reticulum transmembrane protein n=1 Tax=Hucho hucho TaxID=62062 RepID=A0A4W5L339_9TELE